MINRIHILTLVAWLGNLQLAHWQADTRSTTHETLGELYETFQPLLDRFIETEMGGTGTEDFPVGQSMLFTPEAQVGELMDVALAAVAALRTETADDSPDLVNLLDEMRGVINRAKFLLKV